MRTAGFDQVIVIKIDTLDKRHMDRALNSRRFYFEDDENYVFAIFFSDHERLI